MRKSWPTLTPLRLRRLQAGLTLEQVAQTAGISRTRLSAVERFPEHASETEIARFNAAVDELRAMPAPNRQQRRAQQIIARTRTVLRDVLASGLTIDEVAEAVAIPLDALTSIVSETDSRRTGDGR
jgi:predicted transcriptional regulator